MGILEAMGYIVTILGLPAAIFVFVHEQRKQRKAETNELHRRISEEYDNFLRLALSNADLLLFRKTASAESFSEEQLERRDIIFRMLVSLFEKAYIILYTEQMDSDATRRWLSWEDDMREWCRRDDFRSQLDALLEGEDKAFSQHILGLAREENSASPPS